VATRRRRLDHDKEEYEGTRAKDTEHKGDAARTVTKIDSGVTTLVGIVYHERADMH
jgi:hypothetical protein